MSVGRWIVLQGGHADMCDSCWMVSCCEVAMLEWWLLCWSVGIVVICRGVDSDVPFQLFGAAQGYVGGIGGNDVWSLRHGGRVALGNGKIPKITDESG